jgi:hypothetical protein
VWRIDRLIVPDQGSSNGLQVLPVVTRPHPIDMARIEGGVFESWICATCGFTEWYATGNGLGDTLSRLSAIPGSGVSYHDGETDHPYR